MAIIHTTPKQSGTEGLLKLLDALTDEVVLSHGKILMGQFSYGQCSALKLSLFIHEDIYEHIGVRNVFIEDVRDTVVVRFGDEQQTHQALDVLRQTKCWGTAFPSPRQATYHLTELERGATDVRNYLLLGCPPGSHAQGCFQTHLQPKPQEGYAQFNILATLTDYNAIV